MNPLKKTFVITMFGSPFNWIDKYIENVQQLGQYGWEWKIFTPADIKSKGNVEIVKMDTDDFNALVEKKLGVKSNFYLTKEGRPSVHITDYYVASGVIFEDWLKDSNFWGITNLDVVYGRLDHFLPDEVLNKIDVFTDDINNTVNGVFSLWKNVPQVNLLFKQIPHWQEKFSQQPCQACIGGGGQHTLYGTDEYDMTSILQQLPKESNLRLGGTNYYPIHSHDRMEQHIIEVKLDVKPDGSLWEEFADLGAPEWIHKRPYLGREILYFHFIKTKRWPDCLK